jgi:hypothetical protein
MTNPTLLLHLLYSGTELRLPSLGHYVKIGVSVCGVFVGDCLCPAIVSLSSPCWFILAGHLSDTAPQHLPDLLGVR